jgi:ABC-type uncharacterized transport system permease subunit
VYPPSNLPDWLFTLHKALPFYNMAVVIRAGLTVGLVSDLTRSFVVLAAWTLAEWAMTGWGIGRRLRHRGTGATGCRGHAAGSRLLR